MTEAMSLPPDYLGERHPVIRSSAERKPLPPWLREWVLARDGYRCKYCGSTGRLEVDHVVPWSTGGEDISTNLRALCVGCNQARSNFRYWESPRVLPIALNCDRCLLEGDRSDGRSSVHVWCATCRGWSSTDSSGFKPASASYPDADEILAWVVTRSSEPTDRDSYYSLVRLCGQVHEYRSGGSTD